KPLAPDLSKRHIRDARQLDRLLVGLALQRTNLRPAVSLATRPRARRIRVRAANTRPTKTTDHTRLGTTRPPRRPTAIATPSRANPHLRDEFGASPRDLP